MFLICCVKLIFFSGSRTTTESHAMDPQSKNTSKDDLQ